MNRKLLWKAFSLVTVKCLIPSLMILEVFCLDWGPDYLAALFFKMSRIEARKRKGFAGQPTLILKTLRCFQQGYCYLQMRLFWSICFCWKISMNFVWPFIAIWAVIVCFLVARNLKQELAKGWVILSWGFTSLIWKCLKFVNQLFWKERLPSALCIVYMWQKQKWSIR